MGEWIGVGVAMLLVLAFFYWTAATSGGLPPPARGNARYSDHYNLLLHGILKGQLHLDVSVDPVMLSASNPYDPKVWVPHGFMYDTSFYQGKYYIYYGLVPLLAFLLPFRLVTGSDLWLGTAAELATVLAFIGWVWLWLRIRRDYFPRAGGSMVFTSILVLGLASSLPALARRPMMYEFAIATGSLFSAVMLHCLQSALTAKARTRWMTGAGIALGLAFGSRATFLLTILAPAWVLVHLLCRERPWRSPRPAGAPSVRALLGFSAGFGVISFGVLYYNYLRFSDFFDFGYQYLLQDPVSDLKQYWSLSHCWFNLGNYYTSPLAWSRYFPFLTTGPYGDFPRSFYAVADLYGILKYIPIVWFVLAVPLVLRNRRESPERPDGVVAGMVFLAYLGPGVLLLFGGTAFPRYAVDFLPPLILVSILGACALDQSLLVPWARRAMRVVWVGASAVSVLVASLHSIPLQGALTVQRGHAYFEDLARRLNYPTFLYERARDWRYGPVTWNMTFPARPLPTREKLIHTPNASLVVEYTSDCEARFGLQDSERDFVLWGETVPAIAGRMSTLSASFGSLYPHTEHPYYLKHPPSALRSSSVVVTLDGRIVLQGLRPLRSVRCEDIEIADGRPRPGWFSGTVSALTRDNLSISEITPDCTPRSVHVELPAKLKPGRWPLISAGTKGAGDMLFLDVGDAGTARWGYFSTGSPLHRSAPFPIDGEALDLTVRMEALEISGRVPGPPRLLSIEQNGRGSWLTEVPYHPCSAGSIHLAANTLSAPFIQPAFPGEIRWTDTPPRHQPSGASDRLFLRVVFPAETRWGLRQPLLMTGVPGAYDGINVVHYGGGRGRFVLDHGGDLTREGSLLDSLDGESVHDIEIITPVFSLYRGDRRPGHGTVVVKMDGKEVLRFDSELFPAQLGEVAVGENHFGGPTEKHFAGALLMKRWIDYPDHEAIRQIVASRREEDR